MLKSAISLSGLAIRWYFAETSVVKNIRVAYDETREYDSGSNYGRLWCMIVTMRQVSFLDVADVNMFALLKANTVGGPSIVFYRRHEKDKTVTGPCLNDVEGIAFPGHLCKSVKGYNANTLHLYCTMQDMPVGKSQCCYAENNLKMDTKKQLTSRKWCKDGWRGKNDSPLRDCTLKLVVVRLGRAPSAEKMKDAANKLKYICALRYDMVSIWECE